MAEIDIQTITYERALEIENNAVVAGTLKNNLLRLTTSGGTSFAGGSLSSSDTIDVPPAAIVEVGSDEIVIPEWYSPAIENESVEFDITTLPKDWKFEYTHDIQWSHDGRHLAVAKDTEPGLMVFRTDGEKLIQTLSLPSSLPASVRSISWQPVGNYLLLTHPGPPYYSLYSRTGNQFLKIGSTSLEVTEFSTGFRFSPDGKYLIVFGMGPEGYIRLYRANVTSFTRIDDGPTFDSGIWSAEWSPSGRYLAISLHSDTNPIRILEFSDESFTEATSGTVLGLSEIASAAYSVRWSPDNQYLSVTGSIPNGSFVPIYLVRYSEEIFSRVEVPYTPGYILRHTESAWSPDSRYLAIGTQDKSVVVYEVWNGTLTALQGDFLVPTLTKGLVWSPDGRFLTVVGSDTVHADSIAAYKSTGTIPPGVPQRIELEP